MEFYKNFMNDLWSSDHINLKIIIGMSVFFIILCIFLFGESERIRNMRSPLNKTCFIHCKSQSCLDLQHMGKGSDYFISDPDIPYCPFGFWELSHILLHIMIGYFLNLYYSIGLGVIFEFYERFRWNCESYFDIIFNTLGALIGVALRTLTKS